MAKPFTPDVVRKQLIVNVSQAQAFDVWTAQIHLWWPTASHSMSGDAASQVVIEPRVGGRFLERLPEGKELQWGTVLVWEPPAQLSFSWFMGSGSRLPTRVDVQFVPLTAAETRIVLEHRGPNLIGALWETRLAIYNNAWTHVLNAVARHLA